MHRRITDLVVESVRRRHAEGDCPTTAAEPTEMLELALLDLADRRATDGLSNGALFNLLVSRMNFDGAPIHSITLGELERSIDGAVIPK